MYLSIIGVILGEAWIRLVSKSAAGAKLTIQALVNDRLSPSVRHMVYCHSASDGLAVRPVEDDWWRRPSFYLHGLGHGC